MGHGIEIMTGEAGNCARELTAIDRSISTKIVTVHWRYPAKCVAERGVNSNQK